jgi:hypothetical protein
MKTLEDVAGLYRSLAMQNLLQGTTRAYDTGNLYNKIGSFNSVGRMISKEGNRSTMVLNYAPPGAEYGGYVEMGTIFMDKRPFAGNAAHDPQLAKAINEYQRSTVDVINEDIYKKVSVSMKSFTTKK